MPATAAPATGGNLPLGPWWHRTTPEGCETEGMPSRPIARTFPTVLRSSRSRSRMYAAFASAAPRTTPISPSTRPRWQRISASTSTRAARLAHVHGGATHRFKIARAQRIPGRLAGGRQLCAIMPSAACFRSARSRASVGGWFGVNEPNWNCALHRGETGQLFRITNYNGQPYDPSVRLDVYHLDRHANLARLVLCQPRFHRQSRRGTTRRPGWRPGTGTSAGARSR